MTLLCSPANAQRTEDNPVTAAEDAFGTSIGGEDIGLYSATDVRGFSALDAGNVRLEGLTVDRQSEFTSRLVGGSRVRVGLSAQSYPFPAPTGVVDYQLRKPGGTRVVSLAGKADTYGASLFEADAQLPLSESFGIAGGIGFYRNRYFDGGQARVRSMAFVPRWRPGDRIEIVPFWSRIEIDDETSSPVIVPAGERLPRRIERRRYLGQSWTGDDITRSNGGVIATLTGDRWTMRAGGFHSVAAPEQSFSSLLLDATPDGNARQVVVAHPAQRFASDSGELRLSRSGGGETYRHQMHFSLKARNQTRRYGGGDRFDLGTVRIESPSNAPEPQFEFGPQTHERIRQVSGGASYGFRWRDKVEVGVGVQKTDYEKSRTTPEGIAPASHDAPWLHNANVAYHLSPRFAIYASHTRGLEESAVAPQTAVNRDDAPPAIRTRQTDVGMRWVLDDFRLNVAAFTIRKPYHGVDEARLFRQLGDVTHRGWELSIAGETASGLNVVAGAALLDATVRSDDLTSGPMGPRPVGTPERTAFAVLDYRPPSRPSLSVDIGVEHLGRAAANVSNSLFVPSLTVLNLGARYRFHYEEKPIVLRLEATNVLDRFAWTADGGGGLSYNAPRQLSAKIMVDL